MRFPSIATAPFLIGGPFIVTMRRARTIIFMNDEARMTNDELSLNAQITKEAILTRFSSSLGFRHSFDIRHSSFVIFTTLRHSATSKLHASWQSSGITGAVVAGVADLGDSAWPWDASNLSEGNFVDGTAALSSRFHKIVRKQPPLDRQKFPTRSLICSSEIFDATRYIPDCRVNVLRNGVVVRRFSFHAANMASLPG